MKQTDHFGAMKSHKNFTLVPIFLYIISMFIGKCWSGTKLESKKSINISESLTNNGSKGIPEKNPIIDGEVAGEQDFPYIVALRRIAKPESQYGSGSIVSPGSSSSSEWVLTARHNLIDIIGPLTPSPSIYYYPLIVYPKYTNKQDMSSYPKYEVKQTYCHPWPKSQRIPIDDIALIELKTKIELNKSPYNFKSIKLVDKNFDILRRKTITAVGWGYTQLQPNVLPDSLMETDINILQPETCGRIYPNFAGTQKFCAGRKSGGIISTTCAGDSGGPGVIIDGREELLVGIISAGDRICTLPSILMKVSYYREWIDKVMRDRPQELNCENLLKNRPP